MFGADFSLRPVAPDNADFTGAVAQKPEGSPLLIFTIRHNPEVRFAKELHATEAQNDLKLSILSPLAFPKTLSDFAGRGYSIGEMQSKSDAQLLREYAENAAEHAFTEIVTIHTHLVYSAAVRQMNSPDMAAEVTQIVFIGLARGARTLSPRLADDASLAGWLCRSARNISLKLLRDEFRQHSRERQAMEQLSPISETAPD